MDTVKDCQFCFDFEVPSELWVRHVNKLNQKNSKCDSVFVIRYLDSS